MNASSAKYPMYNPINTKVCLRVGRKPMMVLSLGTTLLKAAISGHGKWSTLKHFKLLLMISLPKLTSLKCREKSQNLGRWLPRPLDFKDLSPGPNLLKLKHLRPKEPTREVTHSSGQYFVGRAMFPKRMPLTTLKL